MRRVAGLVFVALSAACAAGRESARPSTAPAPPSTRASEVVASSPEATAADRREAPGSADVPVAVAVPPVAPPAAAAGNGDVLVVVDTARVRKHPAAPHVAALLRSLSGVAALRKRDPGFEPVRDATWVALRASTMSALPTSTVLVRLSGTDAEVTRAFGPITRLDPARPPLGVVRVGPRDVLAPGPMPLTSADVTRGESARRGAALAVTVPDPATSGLRIDPGARDGFLRVQADDATGGADATAEVTAADEASAAALVERGRAALLKPSLLLRVAFRGVFDGLVLDASGTRVQAKVHASAEQLDAVLKLLEAAAGAPSPP